MRNVYQRVRTGKGRRENIIISGCTDAVEIEKRRKLIRSAADKLVVGGRHDRVKDLCTMIGAAKSGKFLEAACEAVDDLLATESLPPDEILFRNLALDWTSGALHEKFPDYVKKKDSDDDKAKLRLYINPIVGDVPLVRFTLQDAEKVMSKLPPLEDFSAASRRHVAQIMYKLLRYAVYPCRIIPSSPLPVGFLPKIATRVAKQYLYPDEDATLLACEYVPLAYRIAYGVLDREGCRTGEMIGNAKKGIPSIGWDAFDLERGMVILDRNKTNDPRAWALDPGVTRALALWKKVSPSKPFPDVDPNHFAPRFREHLDLAEVKRAELSAPATSARRPIRGHDLRATFVTISLANGKSEAWIQDRTGHTSSEMINRYKRLARQFNELHLGQLAPLDEAIPELAAMGGRKARRGGQKVGKSNREKTREVA